MLPISLDIRITAKCNLNCNFCFGSKCSGKELSLQLWYNLLKTFKDNGVKILIITGGEPTLYKHIKDFIIRAKALDFYIVLSTNGLTLNHIDYYRYIDVLSIPIDGETFSDFKNLRDISAEEYEIILKHIKQFKQLYPNKLLKVGTVVTKRNLNSIYGIYDQIRNIADIWKIYQVSKHKNNESIFYSNLFVSDDDFNNLKNVLLENTTEGKPQIVFYDNSQRNGTYLFCEPNGDAMVIKDNNEFIIGNFLKDFSNVINVWHKYVNIISLEKNIKITYGVGV